MEVATRKQNFSEVRWVKEFVSTFTASSRLRCAPTLAHLFVFQTFVDQASHGGEASLANSFLLLDGRVFLQVTPVVEKRPRNILVRLGLVSMPSAHVCHAAPHRRNRHSRSCRWTHIRSWFSHTARSQKDSIASRWRHSTVAVGCRGHHQLRSLMPDRGSVPRSTIE